MRIATLVATGALLAAGAIVSPVTAQQRAAPTDTGMTLTPGAVMRVILLRPNPGMAPEVMRDIRQHLLPILEEEKAAGILVNYSVMTNTTTDSPEDWSVGYTLVYPNWAALDSVGARTNPITLRHYGSVEARTAAANHRAQLGTVVASRLVRLQIVGH